MPTLQEELRKVLVFQRRLNNQIMREKIMKKESKLAPSPFFNRLVEKHGVSVVAHITGLTEGGVRTIAGRGTAAPSIELLAQLLLEREDAHNEFTRFVVKVPADKEELVATFLKAVGVKYATLD